MQPSPRRFFIYGLRRSGNHAIIEWIAKHYNRTHHFNDCLNKPESSNFWRWKELYYGDKSKPTDCIIYSYEDFEPTPEDLKNSTESDTVICIWRDWYNIAASRLKSRRGINTARHRHKLTRDRKAAPVWLEYAKLYDKHPELFVLYNKIIYQPEYLKQVEANLALPKHYRWEMTLPSSKMGDGSSFDNLCDLNLRFQDLKGSSPKLYNELKDSSTEQIK